MVVDGEGDGFSALVFFFGEVDFFGVARKDWLTGDSGFRARAGSSTSATVGSSSAVEILGSSGVTDSCNCSL